MVPEALGLRPLFGRPPVRKAGSLAFWMRSCLIARPGRYLHRCPLACLTVGKVAGLPVRVASGEAAKLTTHREDLRFSGANDAGNWA